MGHLGKSNAGAGCRVTVSRPTACQMSEQNTRLGIEPVLLPPRSRVYKPIECQIHRRKSKVRIGACPLYINVAAIRQLDIIKTVVVYKPTRLFVYLVSRSYVENRSRDLRTQVLRYWIIIHSDTSRITRILFKLLYSPWQHVQLYSLLDLTITATESPNLG